jgi:hypothetical protein
MGDRKYRVIHCANGMPAMDASSRHQFIETACTIALTQTSEDVSANLADFVEKLPKNT